MAVGSIVEVQHIINIATLSKNKGKYESKK